MLTNLLTSTQNLCNVVILLYFIQVEFRLVRSFWQEIVNLNNNELHYHTIFNLHTLQDLYFCAKSNAKMKKLFHDFEMIELKNKELELAKALQANWLANNIPHNSK